MRLLSFFLILTYCGLSQADFWQLDGLQVQSEKGILKLKAERLFLDSLDVEFKKINYTCGNSQQLYPVYQCTGGQLNFIVDEQAYDFNLSLLQDSRINLTELEVTDQAKTLKINWSNMKKNQLLIKVEKYDLQDDLIQSLMKQKLFQALSGFVNADFELNFAENILLSGDYELQKLNLETNDSSLIFADTQIQGTINLTAGSQGFLVETFSAFKQGEMLAKDLYLNFVEAPLDLQTAFELDENFVPSNPEFQLQAQGDNFFQVSSSSPNYTDDFFIEYNFKDLNALYQNYLKSLLELYGLMDFEANGAANGMALVKNGQLSALQLSVEEGQFKSIAKKLEVENLFTEVDWQLKSHQNNSKVRWSRSVVAGMPIGEVQTSFLTYADKAFFPEKIELPIFDGKIEVNQLEFAELFSEFVSAKFNGEIHPVSLELITKKLDWPVMTGTISGKIPGVVKQGSKLTFDGAMNLSVFDGHMSFTNISTERLFGIAPVISGDVSFNGLSLEKITNTYDFGAISGLIDGFVKDLRITNWQTERLEAFVKSVKNKNIKQTISQRALDNISSLGGVQGAISRSFLKFFDEFKYKKLAIGCKLRNSVCEIIGINNSVNGGYSLVEGRGIPKINIIGFRKFIDWEIFLDRLLNARY